MVSYQVHVRESAHQEIRQLPGHMRQRVIRCLRDLEKTPRPVASIALDLTDTSITLPVYAEVRRIRLDGWRIVYYLEDDIRLITVLAIRKRPPYQYDDLTLLLDA